VLGGISLEASCLFRSRREWSTKRYIGGLRGENSMPKRFLRYRVVLLDKPFLLHPTTGRFRPHYARKLLGATPLYPWEWPRLTPATARPPTLEDPAAVIQNPLGASMVPNRGSMGAFRNHLRTHLGRNARSSEGKGQSGQPVGEHRRGRGESEAIIAASR
jgi:hypothetical protein